MSSSAIGSASARSWSGMRFAAINAGSSVAVDGRPEWSAVGIPAGTRWRREKLGVGDPGVLLESSQTRV